MFKNLSQRSQRLQWIRSQQSEIIERMMAMARQQFEQHLFEVNTMISAHFSSYIRTVLEKHSASMQQMVDHLSLLLNQSSTLNEKLQTESSNQGKIISELGSSISQFDELFTELQTLIPNDFKIKMVFADVSVTELIMKTLDLSFTTPALEPMLVIESGKYQPPGPSRKLSTLTSFSRQSQLQCNEEATFKSLPNLRSLANFEKGVNFKLTIEQEPKKWFDPLRPLNEHFMHAGVKWVGGWKRVKGGEKACFRYQLVLFPKILSEKDLIQLLRLKREELWLPQGCKVKLEKN